jgi:hypothetical protein
MIAGHLGLKSIGLPEKVPFEPPRARRRGWRSGQFLHDHCRRLRFGSYRIASAHTGCQWRPEARAARATRPQFAGAVGAVKMPGSLEVVAWTLPRLLEKENIAARNRISEVGLRPVKACNFRSRLEMEIAVEIHATFASVTRIVDNARTQQFRQIGINYGRTHPRLAGVEINLHAVNYRRVFGISTYPRGNK